MLQVTIPLPALAADGGKLNSSVINAIEAGLLNAAGNFNIMHGTTSNKLQTKFYIIDAEQHQLSDLKAVAYRAKRELKLDAINMRVTDSDIIKVN